MGVPASHSANAGDFRPDVPNMQITGPSWRLAKARVSASPSATRAGVRVSPSLGSPMMSTAPRTGP